jgi:SAM-dependent methyltransferase
MGASAMATSNRNDRAAEIYKGNAKLTTDAASKGPLVRLLTDFDYTKRVVRYSLGLPVPMETEDRRVLEQIIFKYFSERPEIQSILFVGCDWYTKHYFSAFFPGTDFHTIDPAAKAERYGSKNHIVGKLEELDRYYPADRFDLIVCNGVFGFGLNESAQCEAAFSLCHSRLRDGGYLVFGWDDMPARTPIPVESIRGLAAFTRFTFPAFKTWRYVTETPYRHTYDFYRK